MHIEEEKALFSETRHADKHDVAGRNRQAAEGATDTGSHRNMETSSWYLHPLIGTHQTCPDDAEPGL